MNISAGLESNGLIYFEPMRHGLRRENTEGYGSVFTRVRNWIQPIVERCRSHTDWMFWACFNGRTKGPCVFWEKDWGRIYQATYIKHIISVLDNWLQHPELRFICK